MTSLVLLLVTACAPGEAPAGGGNGNGNATPPYRGFATPVGIVTGDPMYGLFYAWTGWPGPPAVKPPGFCARVHACLTHKPLVLPPPPPFSMPEYRARPTGTDAKAAAPPARGY
jgi:hypothetical protein